MKHLLLIVLLGCFTVLPVKAQKIRFTDTSNVWVMLNMAQAGPSYYSGLQVPPIKWGRDTFISGHNYRRFQDQAGLYAGPYAIREDVATGKIYFRFLAPNVGGTNTDAMERLFFDYSFRLNDTLKIDFGSRRQWHYVAAIDSLNIGGVMHRKWQMVPVPGGDIASGYSFIEGVGSLSGPGANVFIRPSESPGQLRCFSNSGTRPSFIPSQQLPLVRAFPATIGYLQIDSFDNHVSCTFQSVSVKNFSKKDEVTLAPNPGGTDITLKVPADFHAGAIQITDITGRCIQTISVAAPATNIGQYLSIPGVYYYILQDAATGQRHTGRFIFR